MSFRPPAPSGRFHAPVRSVRPNTWLLTFTAGEWSPVRARHGRPRWCLGAGARRRPVSARAVGRAG